MALVNTGLDLWRAEFGLESLGRHRFTVVAWTDHYASWLAELGKRVEAAPPDVYESIYPVNFDTPDWKNLWKALREVVEFWIARGVRIFRVDNPHTKPVGFWSWIIEEIHREART